MELVDKELKCNLEYPEAKTQCPCTNPDQIETIRKDFSCPWSDKNKDESLNAIE
jgi:hypothetical protein